MTLAACIFTQSYIIHVSDRRVTLELPGERFRVHSEERNKTLLIGLRDGVAVVSYDGRAEMKTPPGVETITTDDALARYIVRQPYPGILNNLAEHIIKLSKYQDFQEYEKTHSSIHMLAYRWGRNRLAAKPLFFRLSVCNGQARFAGLRSKEIYEMFRNRGMTQLLVSQRWATHTKIENCQRQLYRLGPNKELHLAQTMARFLADVSKKEMAVGDHIMAVLIPRVPNSRITAASVFFSMVNDRVDRQSPLQCYRPWVMEYGGGVIEPDLVEIQHDTNLAMDFMGGSFISRTFAY